MLTNSVISRSEARETAVREISLPASKELTVSGKMTLPRRATKG